MEILEKQQRQMKNKLRKGISAYILFRTVPNYLCQW